jgi:transcriptional regulator with XRE-family HTH domain
MMNKSDNTGIGPHQASARHSRGKLTTRRKKALSKPTVPAAASKRNKSNNEPADDNDDNETIEIDNQREKSESDMQNITAIELDSRQVPMNAILAKLREKKGSNSVSDTVTAGKELARASREISRSVRVSEQANLMLNAGDERLLPPGNRIKLHRLRLKIQQTDLAAAASIDQSTLSLIENGERDTSPQIMIRLAYLLGITPATDIFRYYENQLQKEDENLPFGSTASTASAANSRQPFNLGQPVSQSPDFLYLPPELTSEDRKIIHNMTNNLLNVRLTEQGLLSEKSEEETLHDLKLTQEQQRRNKETRGVNITKSEKPQNMHQ